MDYKERAYQELKEEEDFDLLSMDRQGELIVALAESLEKKWKKRINLLDKEN